MHVQVLDKSHKKKAKMSEQLEYWRMMKELRHEKGVERGDDTVKIIADLSSEFDYAIINMPKSVRLIGEGLRLDIFTKSGKWHNILNGQRGQFHDCEKFIRNLLKNKQ